MKVNFRNFNKGPKERKVEVKVERWDTFSMDHTAALIILPLLLQLRDTKHGVPSEFVSRVGGDMDNNLCFDFIQEDENDVFEMEVPADSIATDSISTDTIILQHE